MIFFNFVDVLTQDETKKLQIFSLVLILVTYILQTKIKNLDTKVFKDQTYRIAFLMSTFTFIVQTIFFFLYKMEIFSSLYWFYVSTIIWFILTFCSCWIYWLYNIEKLNYPSAKEYSIGFIILWCIFALNLFLLIIWYFKI